MSTNDIHEGRSLAAGEEVVWSGRPSWRALARSVLHLRGVAAYLGFLLVLDAYQAWVKGLSPLEAVHNSVPLVVIIAVVSGNLVGIAWLMGRTTRYTITSRRVILEYGIAIPATLSLPFSRLQSIAVAVRADHIGDIPLTLRRGEHMPFLKLWPHAQPWHVRHPRPMLRCVPQAAVVAGLLTRAVTAAATAASCKGGSETIMAA